MLKIESLYVEMPNGTGNVEILKNINLNLEKGKFYAITGPNGGGKTSLAKTIMGIYRNTKGSVILDEEDITSYSITDRANKGISYAFQYPARFKGLTVSDILKVAAKDAGQKDFRKLLKAVGLCPEEYLERQCDSSLSGGEIKRIELATVLLKPSKVVIYDEPEAGVDLWSFEGILRLIKDHHSKDIITIVITHHERVLSIADEIILMSDGEIKEMGQSDKMLELLKYKFRCDSWENCEEGEKDDIRCFRS
ncbi:ABC transporter ATP-binding protein [Thermovenabulum sp.]|uniref:ABC transporter ATP-binding protein n=1 Tax=Thermovenabulum sp. TaxID=3100335 RepID=UPI003C7C9992